MIQHDVVNSLPVVIIKFSNFQSWVGIDKISVFHTGDNLDNPVKIELNDKLSIINTESKTTMKITDLKPGNRYLFNITFDDETVSFPIVPSCSCDPLLNPDKTGRPKGLRISQDNGHVRFTFTDNSRCGSAFSFTRFSGYAEFVDDSALATSFTSDYSFSAPTQCSADAIVDPGITSSDDLRRSRLALGDTYSYCVRAVNPGQYMDLTLSGEVSRVVSSSAAICESHTISWEASIDGLITTEPNAGSLPINNVTVAWQLLSEDGTTPLACDGCTDSTKTDRGGAFAINFNVIHHSLKNKNLADIPVSIKFSKTTSSRDGEINHLFLCNEGQNVCDPEGGHIFYLRHLHFDNPLHIYDDTSIPFSGKITIHGTGYEGSPDGCPIIGAKVCPQHHTTVGILEDLVCVTSDSNGEYVAPIVMGAMVHGVEITYNSHVFEKNFENNWNYNTGVRIKEGGFYGRNDFMDVTKARMYVQGKLDATTRTNFLSTQLLSILFQLRGGIVTRIWGKVEFKLESLDVLGQMTL